MGKRPREGFLGMDEFTLKKLKEIRYERQAVEKGYANRTLHVDLSDGSIAVRPVTAEMKEVFVGGKGFDLWLLWHAVKGSTRWNDPENALCIASGPLGGTPIYPGSGKSIVTSISATTGSVVDSNVGGYFGPYLKFSGFDALEIRGKSGVPTIILIDGIEQKVDILEVSGLPEEAHEITALLTDHFGRGRPRDISVVATGPGACHTLIGCLNFSWYDRQRGKTRLKQAGRGGLGTVFADKGLKALVVRWDKVTVSTNDPADEASLKLVARLHSQEIVEQDPKQNHMSSVGTAHLVTIMNDYDLLPVRNYRYGQHAEAARMGEDVFRQLFDKGYDGCWIGCTLSCAHCVKDFVPVSGPYKGQKVLVDGPEYETIAGCGSNLGIFDPLFAVEMNFYCDTYGLDSISVGTSIAFVMDCFESGLIDKKASGGMDLSFGNKEAALELVHQMARGEGFGCVVGKGIRKMKEIFADSYGADRNLMGDIGMEAKGLEFSEYMSKESLAQQGGYGLALKGPQHDEAWLIFLDMVHNFLPTFEKKAEALHWFPLFRTWFGLCGLCKLPWNDVTPADNKQTKEPAKVMQHVEWYARYFSAVTGREVVPGDLIAMSERVYNFQRIFSLRMGFGRREHDSIPYRAMGPVTAEEYESRVERYDGQLKTLYDVDIEGLSTVEKVKLLRRFREERYEQLKDAVYERRGWTKDGIPKLATVRRLGIDFPEVLAVLKAQGAA
jgi:aldehyde:ferredoxin oxidoreductase